MRYNITSKRLYNKLLKIFESFKGSEGETKEGRKTLSVKKLSVEELEVVETLHEVLSKDEPDYDHLFESVKMQIHSSNLQSVNSNPDQSRVKNKLWIDKVFFKGAGVAAAAVVLLLLVFNFHQDISGWLNGYGKNVSPDIVAKLNHVHDRHRAKLIIDNAFEINLYGDTASFMIDGLGVGFGSIKVVNKRDGRTIPGYTMDGRSAQEYTGDGRSAQEYTGDGRSAQGYTEDGRTAAAKAEAGQVQMHTLIVPKGGEFFITLSDGTQVFLNSNSKLTFPSRFTDSKREVLLEGEALFTVTKNGTPFNVVSQNSVTTVLGTVFNIKSCPGTDKVTLCSGSVSVSNSEGSDSHVITPSHQATVSTSGIQVAKADVMEIVAWTEGKFYFKNIPLEEIASKLYDWYDIEFDFDNPALRQVPFTGMINRNSSLSTVFELFEMSYNIKFKVTDKTVVIKSGFAK